MKFGLICRMSCFFVSALAPAVLSAANPLGVANAYNVFVFSNFTETGSDTGGRIAAGGNVSFSGTYAVTQSILDLYLAPNNDSLVVDGTVTSGTGSILHGNAFRETAGAGSVSMTGGGTLTTGGASPIGVAALQSSYVNYSTQLSQLSSTGSVNNNGFGTITLTGGNSTINIFSVNIALLGGSNTFNINIPTSATAIINVTGTTGTTTNAGMFINGAGVNGDSSTGATKVLFNFYQATGLTLGGGFLGTVLAPNANVTGTNFAQLDGGLIANSFTGSTEFHDQLFTGGGTPSFPSAPTPEAGTSALIGFGLIGLAGIAKLKSQNS